MKSSLSIALIATASVAAFVPSQQNIRQANPETALRFGIPTFQPKDEDKDPKEEKKVGIQGLIQLVAAGMGAPFLGDFDGVDEESGKFMFSLEANNLVDEDGKSKQTSMPYFESGWVDPEDLKKEGNGFKLPWQK